MESDNSDADDLPPSPPLVSGHEPLEDEETKIPLKARSLVQRNGFGRKEQTIKLLTNHFKVSLVNSEEFFYHYSVKFKYEDDTPVDLDRKWAGRKVMEKLQQAYAAELENKDFAYDGRNSLFTIGALQVQGRREFTVVIEDVSTGNDRKRVRRTKTYKVELSFAARVPISAISQALSGQEPEHTQEAIRVIDIILRHHSAKQGYLLVRQSFFHNNPKNFVDLGGGVMGCRGFHSSFHATQSGLSLNIDVSTTMLVISGLVIDFLLANQKVGHPSMIDWAKAKRALKNLRIETSLTNQVHRIVGLSDRPCREQLFTLKLNNGDSVEITVFDYYVKKGIELQYSSDLPCINVGKPKRPIYFPVELCSLLPLQRYTKALSTLQRSSLVEKSRHKPQERISILSDETTRPTHYHVLHDEIGFNSDDLQELVHSLSYVYQRSTTAIKVVAPIRYAHLAAAQVRQFMEFDKMSETSSSDGGHTSAGSVPIQALPRLHENVRNSMFFC